MLSIQSNTLAVPLDKCYLMENSKPLLNTMKSMRTKGGGAFSLRCNALSKLFIFLLQKNRSVGSISKVSTK